MKGLPGSGQPRSLGAPRDTAVYRGESCLHLCMLLHSHHDSLLSTSGATPSLCTKPGEDLMAQVWFGSKSQPTENCQLNGDSEARQKSHKFPSNGSKTLRGKRELGTVWKNI